MSQSTVSPTLNHEVLYLFKNLNLSPKGGELPPMTTGKAWRFPALWHHSLVLNQGTQKQPPWDLMLCFTTRIPFSLEVAFGEISFSP